MKEILWYIVPAIAILGGWAAGAIFREVGRLRSKLGVLAIYELSIVTYAALANPFFKSNLVGFLLLVFSSNLLCALGYLEASVRARRTRISDNEM